MILEGEVGPCSKRDDTRTDATATLKKIINGINLKALGNYLSSFKIVLLIIVFLSNILVIMDTNSKFLLLNIFEKSTIQLLAATEHCRTPHAYLGPHTRDRPAILSLP
jgi:hypothetical protein